MYLLGQFPVTQQAMAKGKSRGDLNLILLSPKVLTAPGTDRLQFLEVKYDWRACVMQGKLPSREAGDSREGAGKA